MKMKQYSATALAILCAVSLMTGCGGKSSADTVSASSQTAPAAAAYEDSYAAEYYDGDYDTVEEAEEESKTSVTSESGGLDVQPDQEAANTEEKLVYTAYMTIQTLTFPESSDYIRGKIAEFGGIIENESTYDGNNRWYYYEEKTYGTLTTDITVRIPSANFKAFLSSLEGAGGKIVNQSQTVENITKRYNDQSILIESLKTQEERLLQMMEKAETVEDMIYIEQRLSEVQTQLNQAKNVLSGMDTDVAYSTVHLTLQEVVRYETRRVQSTFGDRLANTVSDSWDNFLGFLESFLFFLIYLFPIACLVLVILLIVFGIRKIYLKAHPERAAEALRRKEAKKAAKEARAMRKINHQSSGMYNDPAGGFGSTFQAPEADHPENEDK